MSAAKFSNVALFQTKASSRQPLVALILLTFNVFAEKNISGFMIFLESRQAKAPPTGHFGKATRTLTKSSSCDRIQASIIAAK